MDQGDFLLLQGLVMDFSCLQNRIISEAASEMAQAPQKRDRLVSELAKDLFVNALMWRLHRGVIEEIHTGDDMGLIIEACWRYARLFWERSENQR